MDDTTDDAEETQQSAVYVYGLGFFLGCFVLITLCYVSYICKRRMRSRSLPPPPIISVAATNNDNNHFIRIPPGLDDDHLVTFPTFVYSDAMMTQNGNTATDANSSGCSICLVDYKPADVLRLLPECGHLFHVKCIDTWLKVHPTCPVCRNSPLAETVQV